MTRPAALGSSFRLTCLLLLVAAAGSGMPGSAQAYGPQGFDTVIIDAGHGGIDRGGGPGQRIPEKPYTLDAAIRLQRALSSRGFRTVMTRTQDVFVPLPTRVAIANSYRDAVFVSLHFNSAPRAEAHGYETYYYRPDSFGLATRLHRAQLATLNTDDRHVRRRGFYVVRRPYIPAVLCEGGFLTNPEESRFVTDASYRQRWAENLADAFVAQRREGDPSYMGAAPVVTSERLVSSGGSSYSGRRSRGGRGGRHHYSRGSSRGSSRSHRGGHGSSRTHHGSSTTTHHRRRHTSN